MASKGGSRPGAGRKSGEKWNGSGTYQRKVRVSVGFDPALYEWLKEEAKKCGLSMSVLVNETVALMRSNSLNT